MPLRDFPMVCRAAPAQPDPDGYDRARWRLRLAAFFRRPAVEIAVAVLVLVSVVLTLVEITLEAQHHNLPGDPYAGHLRVLEWINLAITAVFIVELTLRWLASLSTRKFFREYWLDVIAVLPWLRVFRVARVLRLLRLLRLLTLFNRHVSSFPYIFRQGLVEYVIVTGLVVLSVVFGTAAILAFEAAGNDEVDTFGEAALFSVYTLIAGEPTPGPPKTLAGQVVALFLMFMGLGIFAMFTGTVSAFMVERFRTEGRPMDLDELHDHTILCGWNYRAEIVLKELIAARGAGDDMPILCVSGIAGEPDFNDDSLRRHVVFLHDDYTKVGVLQRVGVQRAAVCIVLSDTSEARSEQDRDARTILAALTVEKLNPDIYTCAELINREYGSHLEMGHVNDYVVSGDHSAFLLAQAAMNRGLMDLFRELLTHERGNQFYRITVPGSWTGRDFLDLFVHMKRRHNAILVAVTGDEAGSRVNPDDYVFAPGDSVMYIAAAPIVLSGPEG